MKLLNNMTVRLSWMLVLAFFSTVVVALSALGLYSVHYAERSQEQLLDLGRQQQEDLRRIVGLQGIAFRLQELLQALGDEQSRLGQALQREQAQLGDTQAPPAHQVDKALLDERLNRLQAAFAAFVAPPHAAGHEARLKALQERFAGLLDNGLRPQLQELVRRNPAVAAEHGKAAGMYGAAFLAELEKLGQALAGGERMTQGEGAWIEAAIEWAIYAALFVSVLTVAIVLWGVTANVLRPLQRVVEHCEQIAAGDLASHIEVHSTNEIGKLFAALADIQQRLAQTVSTVRRSSRLIHEGAQAIAEGSRSLSTRTVQQSASLENTASSMEQLTSTVSQNADNAHQANALADSAAEVARRGGTLVAEVVSTMGGISDSSHKVAEIIKLIDSIAFQTNILALNASVEAARAGEQGRGFAVVAGEVRNLASRSAQASKEIRDLITASVDQVDAGSKLVEQAGGAMQEIVESVQKVADIMDEISAASREQSNGISLVDKAVLEMDAVTQQNANLVKETNQAADELVGEAHRLREVVDGFRIDTAPGFSASRQKDGSWAQRQFKHAEREVAQKELPATVRQERTSSEADDDWQTF
ncbi:methyl-accepting chemotaxis protein [Azotobacter vinelandii]|uniref:methyl-accepting chemotaxis protein n=1 Tax=Azotobacter TaxID=352 RepID=UPI000911EC40|nr:methyl-accepting chemotaxis protein [Azotobacter vinelandii]GLK58207.1 methyl-accepting chemotaxis protein [Azotobacter vinelandii]SFX90302.1 methyl-accepting chemotaxis sensory transducer with TarH sensor [Azotobacter vinelandii]